MRIFLTAELETISKEKSHPARITTLAHSTIIAAQIGQWLNANYHRSKYRSMLKAQHSHPSSSAAINKSRDSTS